MTQNEKSLLDHIDRLGSLDGIVVEGYDGVGKGRVLEILAEHYGVTPYRPDYNLWQMFDHRKEDRWKVSGFFWDVFSHFYQTSGACSMLFDRGVLSGAVYNQDMRIAMRYKEMLRDMRILHILVECSEEDYLKFSKARDTDTYLDKEIALKQYRYYNGLYHQALQLSKVNYIIYQNEYEESLSDRSKLCKGCGHYAYGWCRHSEMNVLVDGNNYRCEYSKDTEVQDRNDSQVYSMQS